MKKYLLPENLTPYKANLHCHTTISDGVWTPEQVKEEYESDPTLSLAALAEKYGTT